MAMFVPGRQLTPAALLGGIYLAAPRAARFWPSPRNFIAVARREARLDRPRWWYRQQVAESRRHPQATLNAHKFAPSAVKLNTKAHRRTMRQARRYMRARGRPYELRFEDYLLAAAELTDSGLAAPLAASGFRLDQVRAGEPPFRA